MSEAVYGYCPECGARGSLRERRPNGNDTCENGHVYPSASFVPEPLPPVPAFAPRAPPAGMPLGVDGMCISNLDGEEAMAALQAGVPIDSLLALTIPPQQIAMGVDPSTGAMVVQCVFAFPPGTFKAQGASMLVAASGQSAQPISAFFAPLPRGEAPGMPRIPPRGEGIPRLRVVTSMSKLTDALRKQLTGG